MTNLYVWKCEDLPSCMGLFEPFYCPTLLSSGPLLPGCRAEVLILAVTILVGRLNTPHTSRHLDLVFKLLLAFPLYKMSPTVGASRDQGLGRGEREATKATASSSTSMKNTKR